MAPVLVVALATLVHGLPERDRDGRPHLRSESAFVRFADDGEVLLTKNPDVPRPIASVTKLMTALVLLTEHGLPSGPITLTEDDRDRLKHSRSRLPIGRTYTAEELLTAGLAASDNRAMFALVRAAGIERALFVEEMNRQAHALGMTRSRFADPTGLDPGNSSTARELVALVAAVSDQPLLAQRGLETSPELVDERGRTLRLGNPNRLARSSQWTLVLGKTGYTVEAGRNLVLRAIIAGRPVDLVFLGSREMDSVFGDAGRVRRWLLERLAATPGAPGAAPAARATGMATALDSGVRTASAASSAARAGGPG